MEALKVVNVLDDKKAISFINSLAILIGLIVYAIGWKLLGGFKNLHEINFSAILIELIKFAIMFILLIIIHEITHGVFFKIFYPKGSLKFDFKNGMAYASIPGAKFKAYEYFIISVSPFLVNTLLIFLFSKLGPFTNYTFLVLLACHTGACAGDFYYIYLIIKYGDQIYEDTSVGMTIWPRG